MTPRSRAAAASSDPPETAREEVTSRQSLGEAREAAMGCRACELWERGTQTVFGEGPAPAAVMLVGEQPGHEEDLTGHPFVGPAGRLLDRALETAGLDRKTVYVTNGAFGAAGGSIAPGTRVGVLSSHHMVYTFGVQE